MATNGTSNHQDQHKSAPVEQYTATSGAAESNTGSASGNDLSKDEVGWYFVEQYYTTLSKSPEKLHVGLKLTFSEIATNISKAILRQALSICLWR
jgi:hypothetical protein